MSSSKNLSSSTLTPTAWSGAPGLLSIRWSLPVRNYQRLARLPANTTIRFTGNDFNVDTVVELGIDAFQINELTCSVPGDLDGDGIVGIIDFLMLLAEWGPCPDPCPPSCAADLDGDCSVGITDFLLLLANWT